MFLVYLFIPLLSFACRSSAWISPSNISAPSVLKNRIQNQLLASSSIVLRASAESSQDDDETPCDLPEDNVYLLNRIGGEPALEAAVEEFYARVVVDEKLMRYFEGVPMENLKGHQLNFLRMAFTEIPGDCDITDYLTTSHDRLWEMGLDETDFDAVAGHLVAAMQALGVEQDLIDEAVEIVVPLRSIFEVKKPSKVA